MSPVSPSSKACSPWRVATAAKGMPVSGATTLTWPSWSARKHWPSMTIISPSTPVKVPRPQSPFSSSSPALTTARLYPSARACRVETWYIRFCGMASPFGAADAAMPPV